MNKKIQTPKKELKLIKDLLVKSYSNKQIALEIGKSATYVASRRFELGYPSAKTVKSNIFMDKIKMLCEKGYTDEQIGRFVNRNHRTVWFYRQKQGIPASMPEITYNSDYDRIKGYMIRNSKFTAKRRNIEFNLKYTDFELPDYCPLLNIKLTYRRESDGNHSSHATLDRIDNKKGYTPGNVIIISRLANAMKNCANFDELLLFSTNIKILVDYYKNQGALGNITDVFPNIKIKKI